MQQAWQMRMGATVGASLLGGVLGSGGCEDADLGGEKWEGS